VGRRKGRRATGNVRPAGPTCRTTTAPLLPWLRNRTAAAYGSPLLPTATGPDAGPAPHVPSPSPRSRRGRTPRARFRRRQRSNRLGGVACVWLDRERACVVRRRRGARHVCFLATPCALQEPPASRGPRPSSCGARCRRTSHAPVVSGTPMPAGGRAGAELSTSRGGVRVGRRAPRHTTRRALPATPDPTRSLRTLTPPPHSLSPLAPRVLAVVLFVHSPAPVPPPRGATGTPALPVGATIPGASARSARLYSNACAGARPPAVLPSPALLRPAPADRHRSLALAAPRLDLHHHRAPVRVPDPWGLAASDRRACDPCGPSSHDDEGAAPVRVDGCVQGGAGRGGRAVAAGVARGGGRGK
jgi:hypothetical protein